MRISWTGSIACLAAAGTTAPYFYANGRDGLCGCSRRIRVVLWGSYRTCQNAIDQVIPRAGFPFTETAVGQSLLSSTASHGRLQKPARWVSMRLTALALMALTGPGRTGVVSSIYVDQRNCTSCLGSGQDRRYEKGT